MRFRREVQTETRVGTGSRFARPEEREPMAEKNVSYIIVPVVYLIPANHKSAFQHRAIKLELVGLRLGCYG
jgi:hypothetical protein